MPDLQLSFLKNRIDSFLIHLHHSYSCHRCSSMWSGYGLHSFFIQLTTVVGCTKIHFGDLIHKGDQIGNYIVLHDKYHLFLLVLFTNTSSSHLTYIFILYRRYLTLWGWVLLSVKAEQNIQSEELRKKLFFGNLLWSCIFSLTKFVLQNALSSTLQYCSAAFWKNPNICGFHLSSWKKLSVSYFARVLHPSNFCFQQKMKLAAFAECLLSIKPLIFQ